MNTLKVAEKKVAIFKSQQNKIMSSITIDIKRHPIPFRYPGGKFYALGLLAPFWQIEHDEFREPFLGGGSVFFTKPKSNRIF